MDHEEIIIEAKAKIMWGESPEEVHLFMISNGIPASEAADFIEHLVEVEREVEHAGSYGTTVIGLLMILGGFGGAVFDWTTGRAINLRFVAVAILVGFFGVSVFLDGVLGWRRSRR